MAVVMLMPEDNDEDWMKYASAGFGQTDYSLWDEESEEVEVEEEPEQLDLDLPEQLGTHMEEIPRAPNPAGLKHLVRSGCCDFCLGRLGGKKRYEQTIEDSGKEIRQSVLEGNSHLASVREEITLCPFCENLFEEADLLADIIFDRIEPFEIKRLQLGTRFPKDQIEEEDAARKRYAATGSDGLKTGLVTEIARNLNKRLEGVTLVNEKPHVLALIDVLTLTVELDVRAHYIYGRYRKLERGIPQTKWPCRACKGRGCEKCNNTGLQYESSVQDLIGNPILDVLQAPEHSFHGMGREDIDVRCMGRGRPFVIELKEPKLRSCNYQELENLINEKANGSIEVSDLRSSNRSEVVRVKDTPAEKSYTIRYKIEPITVAELDILTQVMEIPKKNNDRNRRKKNHYRKKKDKTEEQNEVDYSTLKKAELVDLCVAKGLAKSGTKDVLIDRLLSYKEPTLPLPDQDFVMDIMQNLQGCTLAQRTPERVAHRRADKIRKRKVMETSNPTIDSDADGNMIAEFSLRCESGTYVKETVHGDGGRTQPSIASLIKAKCTVEWLDVADIHAD